MPELEASWNASHANAGWVLWACMHTLAGLKNVYGDNKSILWGGLGRLCSGGHGLNMP